MKMNIYYSNTYRGAFDQLCQALKENRLSDRYKIKTHYVIVPDRFSLTIEKAILDKLNIVGAIDIEVVSFSRLANIILGDKVNRCLSPESAVMLMAKVIRENKDNLHCYHKIQDITAFSKDMYASISEIRNNDISPDILENILPKINNQGIKNKTADIIMLYKLYLKELYDTYNDQTTKLERLIEEIPISNKIVNNYIYITDFYYFKEIEYNIISALMRHAKSLDIALIKCDEMQLNRRIYPFYKIEQIAKEHGVYANIHYKPCKLNHVNSAIEKRLFSFDTHPSINSDNRVGLFYTDDKISEIQAVAREIKREVRGGLRYNDLAIVCGDIQSYMPIIESVFKKFQIPYFIDIKESISNHPLTRYLFSLFDFSVDNSIGTALEIVKNIFFDEDYDRIKEFDNYCYEYKIHGSQLWNDFVMGDEGKRAIPNKVRLKLVGVLDAFNLKDNDTVDNYINNIIRLFDMFDYNAILAHLRAEQLNRGDIRYAEITNQLSSRINELMKEMSEILGDQQVSLDEFVVMFKAHLASASISMIPQYIDSVIIGEPLESRFAIIKSLYIVGASDNNIPYNRQDTGIITSRERKEWGLSIYPDIVRASYLDKLYLHQLLIKAEERLYISYTSKAQDGDLLNPSIIISQLSRIFDIPLETVDSIGLSLQDSVEDRAKYYAYRFATKENAYEELIHYIRQTRNGVITNIHTKPYDALYALLDEDLRLQIGELNNIYSVSQPYIARAKELFFKADEYTSVSQLQSYFGCPFKHFLRYGLRIKRREEITLDVLKIGTIIHYALERFVIRVLDKYPKFDDYHQDIEQIIQSVVKDIMVKDEYSQLLEDARYNNLIIDSIVRFIDVLCETIDNSKFKPFTVEAELRNYPLNIVYNGLDIKLKGKIDRVDRYGNSVIVVDYKTGKIDKNLINGLYYGNKIQLFIYLKAIIESGYKPGGLLYMDIKNKFSKEMETVYPYTGYISKDSIADFELRPKTLISTKQVLNRETLERLIDYSIDVSRNAIGEIAQGYIEPKPLNEECRWCDYKDICISRLSKPNYRKASSKNIGNIQ